MSEEEANCPQISQVHFVSFEITGLISSLTSNLVQHQDLVCTEHLIIIITSLGGCLHLCPKGQIRYLWEAPLLQEVQPCWLLTCRVQERQGGEGGEPVCTASPGEGNDLVRGAGMNHESSRLKLGHSLPPRVLGPWHSPAPGMQLSPGLVRICNGTPSFQSSLAPWPPLYPHYVARIWTVTQWGWGF